VFHFRSAPRCVIVWVCLDPAGLASGQPPTTPEDAWPPGPHRRRRLHPGRGRQGCANRQGQGLSPKPDVLHVTTREAWNRAQRRGEYRADGLATEGFLQGCLSSQLSGVVSRCFSAASTDSHVPYDSALAGGRRLAKTKRSCPGGHGRAGAMPSGATRKGWGVMG
jgi:hypothetical protein